LKISFRTLLTSFNEGLHIKPRLYGKMLEKTTIFAQLNLNSSCAVSVLYIKEPKGYKRGMKSSWKLFAIIGFLLFSVNTFAQGKMYSGSVIDLTSEEPIPYATVVLLSNTTDRPVTGTTTNDLGEFSLRTDSTDIYLRITFMGYEENVIRELNEPGPVLNIGIVSLKSMTQNIGEVQVTAEKSTMEFKLDKRVFNVGSDIGTTGMGALDVLGHVPSVTVDIEGNIKLRGNSGVQILINGKPSVLSDDPSKALGTITADMIESIEVITNPSAKYDASGTSGILNIILKKEENKGFNGSISLNTGIPHNHSIGGTINYRTKKLNLFTQFGAGYRSMPEYSKGENKNLINSSSIVSDGTGYRNEYFYNLTLGTDYYINDLNTLTLSGNFAYEVEQQPSENNFYIYDGSGALTNQYQRTEVTSALNPKYQYDLQYKKQFKNNKEHTFNISALGRYFGKDQSSDFTNTPIIGENIFANQQTETKFYQSDQTYKIDYVNPFKNKFTLETGAMYDINDVGNDYAVYNLETIGFVEDSSLTNNFEFNQKVLAGYLTGSYEGSKWGLKLGLRAENTDLITVLTNTNQENNRNYTNLFPSIHTSYKVSNKIQFQAGYSKRIFRPRLWDLNPFFNIRNNFNIRTGNPNLMPEFADSYELTSIFYMKKLTLNSSVYYLYTTDVKETIFSFNDGVTTVRPENVGTNQKIGFEVNWKYVANKWFTANGDFNYGKFNRKGTFETQNFDFSGDQYSAKLTTKFKLKWGLDIEFSGNYESKVKTIQGTTSGFPFADAGLRKRIWKGKGVINFSVRDIFASRIRENYINQATYSVYSFSKRGTFVTLGFSYSFGKGEAMSYSGGGHH
jgi:outer membrane receptor protein involved in Fe transport